MFCGVTRCNLVSPALGQKQTCGSNVCKDSAMTVAQHTGHVQHSHPQPFAVSTNTYGNSFSLFFLYDVLITSFVFAAAVPPSQRYSNAPSEPQAMRTQTMLQRVALIDQTQVEVQTTRMSEPTQIYRQVFCWHMQMEMDNQAKKGLQLALL